MLKRTGQEDLGILKEELPEKNFLTKKMMWPYGLASTFSCTLHISFIRCVKDTQTCIMNDFMLKIWIFLVKNLFPEFLFSRENKIELYRKGRILKKESGFIG